MQSFYNKSMDRLLQAITDIRTLEECYAFFEDLCTIKELQDMAQRFDTAILLDQGKSYQQIADLVGISTATISRVSRCLAYGTGGYRAAIDKVKQSEKNGETEQGNDRK